MMTEWVVVACLMVAVVRAYPNGPPITTDQSLCASMYPTHNVTETTTPSPYEIFVDTPNCYTAGSKVLVSIKSNPGMLDKSGKVMEMEGLMMEARPQNVVLDAFGSWSAMPSNILKFRTDTCFGKTASVISQKQELESTCEAVYWMPPANFTQTVQFVATIIEDEDVFWINVMSPLIQYKATCAGTGTECVRNPNSPIPTPAPTSAPAPTPAPAPGATPAPGKNTGGKNSAGIPELHVTAILTTLLLFLTSLQ